MALWSLLGTVNYYKMKIKINKSRIYNFIFVHG